MQFRIADSFSKALGRLTGQEQAAVKITVFDLQQDPAAPGLKFHRVDASRDANFWSVRVNRDIRLIVHKTAASLLICYVDHHDRAYDWAARRRIEAHPKTGAAQIVEVRERVEEIVVPVVVEAAGADVAQAPFLPPLFLKLSEDDLLDVGVPPDWVGDVRLASEDRFLELADHIPAEAAEALLDYVATGTLRKPEAAADGESPFDHPDAQRRFRVLDDVDELARALEEPWERWAIFLHPAQRRVVARDFGGPARVAGSAGTGKTVVALHRAAQALKRNPGAKVLLTTFSTPLAGALAHKLRLLTGESDAVTILPFEGVAGHLHALAFGEAPRAAPPDQVQAALEAGAAACGLGDVDARFLAAEFNNVVDAWQIETPEAYRTVPRLGRKARLGAKQRARLWPVFVHAREALRADGLDTWPGIFGRVQAHYAGRAEKPFTHIVVDEAQDLGVPELRMLAAIADPATLFFAGDLGQRIFREPFSWKALGIDVRGRSITLKVNYRTSHQIRRAVDGLLPPLVRDVDGNEQDRRGTVSVFNGPDPEIRVFPDADGEIEGVALWLFETIEEGIEPGEVGIFVRGEAQLPRALAVVQAAGQTALELSGGVGDAQGRVAVGTMHLAKGLEFKAVAVIACDDELLPSQSRIETAADEAELDEIFETERHLFYVACTRARDRLIVSGVAPASDFFADLALRV